LVHGSFFGLVTAPQGMNESGSSVALGDHGEIADPPLVGLGALEAALGGLMFGVLEAFGLGGDAPPWLMALATLGLVTGQVRPVVLLLTSREWLRRTNLRIALSSLLSAVLLFGSGWGSLMVVSLLIHVISEVRQFGSRVWRVTLAWSVGTSVLCQTLVVTGVISTNLTHPVANASFFAGLVGLIICGRGYGATTEKLERTEARFRALVQNSHDVVIVAGLNGEIVYVSPAASRVLGHSPQRLIEGWGDLVHPDDRMIGAGTLELVREPGSSTIAELRARHGDGQWRWWEVTTDNHILDPAVRGIVSHIRDITERKAYQETLSYQATRDALTGLLNRPAFLEAVETSLARARQHGRVTAVLFLDLDGFKAVNDTLGHHAGDQLLETVARRVEIAVRSGDTVARFAGDEFTVLLEDLAEPAEAYRISERIQCALDSPLDVDGTAVRPAASIGVAVTTEALESAEQILRKADLKMYRSKQSRSRETVLDDPGDDHLPLNRAEFERALRDDEFFVEYQPVFDLATRAVVGVEALARWRHPTMGLVTPDTFIPRAEASGMIIAFGRRVLEEACRTGQDWAEHTPLDLLMAVNASVSQFCAIPRSPRWCGLCSTRPVSRPIDW
jgi:diguanylate cyclase (GGDEF)-like protein/PAS domain S-box-containing protein